MCTTGIAGCLNALRIVDECVIGETSIECCQVILKHEGNYGNYELDANRIKRVILETKGGLHIAGCLNAIRIKRTVRDVYCRLPEC